MESHASAAREGLIGAARHGLMVFVRRLYTDVNVAVTVGVAVVLATIAFVGNGGLQLGASTFVEISVIMIAAALVAAALVLVGVRAAVHGGTTLAAFTVLAGITALSITWSLYPSDTWVETDRTFAYLAAFAAGIAAVRIARGRWAAIGWGVLLALGTVSLYGLATKVAPGWLNSDEIYARLREPYGYWNAVGLTAAMGMPLCLWVGTRDQGRRASGIVAYPLLAVFIVTMLLSYSRGSIIAAVAGVAVWIGLVPLRLRSLALLGTSALAGGIVTAWAFSQSALSDDRVALGAREDAGVKLGLILLAMIVLTAAAGYAIQRRAEQHPLPEQVRRKIGIGALGALAAMPLVLLVALAFSNRGIGGTISSRWHDLTSEQRTPQNNPGRLIQTGSVRTVYWNRAIKVFDQHKFKGAGAGSFAQAQLKFRDQPVTAQHAHGYVHQTLADLGLVGLAVSVLALIAWFLTAGRTLALWPRPGQASWTPERLGLMALALVVLVFGVHSTIDWTWFVPAVAVTALFLGGWVVGRGPLFTGSDVSSEAAVPPLSAVRPEVPRGRALHLALVPAVAVLAFAILTSIAVSEPWRSGQKGNDAIGLAGSGSFGAARAAANSAHSLDPLSVDPYFDRAAVEDAAGNKPAAIKALEQAVQTQPSSSEAWRRLGEYYLNNLSQPATAVPYFHAAIYLDPLSDQNRNDYVSAIRAQEAAIAAVQLQQAQARRARASKVRLKKGIRPTKSKSTRP